MIEKLRDVLQGKNCLRWVINSARKMEPVYIYFKETLLDDQNRFTLDFSNEITVNEILFSPDKDYYITSMNCDLKLLKDFQAHRDILDDTKKLSKLGCLLLEKGPNYQMMCAAFTYI